MNFRIVSVFTPISKVDLKELEEVFDGLADEHAKHFSKRAETRIPGKVLHTVGFTDVGGRFYKLRLKMAVIVKDGNLDFEIRDQDIQELTMDAWSNELAIESQNPNSGWKDI